MPSGVRLKQLAGVLLPALALTCAIPVAASAHGGAHSRHGAYWHHGFWGHDATVAGTVTSVSTGSFGANAYVVSPGAGNSGTTPTATAGTILIGPNTKVITPGQTGITSGDDFFALYRGVPSDTPLTTLEADDPTVVVAYIPPTPEVEVKGVVTTPPASGSDTFVATAYVVTPPRFFTGDRWNGGGGSSGGSSGSSNDRGYGYSYGGNVGGRYGYRGSRGGRGGHARAAALRGSHCLPGSTPVADGTPGTVITTDSTTKITIDGQTSSVGNLASGDHFVAVYDGTPDESLATITSTPALSVEGWAPFDGNALYAFVGTVAGTDTTTGTVTVNVTSSIPSGLFSGTDTFDVGSQTIVLGNSTNGLFGSLGAVSNGDVVAGGLIAASDETASTVESTPLQVLIDFPQMSSSSSSAASIRRAERRALRLLRRERATYGRHRRR